MNEKVVSYEADIDQKYEDLTEKHKAIKSQLENAIIQYIKDGKGKPVTIQGPYGSGKTQLLYHLFKFTWENGGIGIYVHLEKVLPPNEMGPEEYAEYLKEFVNEEVQLLKKGEGKSMTGKVRDYAVNNIKKIGNDNMPIVLFVDEVEQQYKLLDTRVTTDDHSPMRAVIARVNNGEAGFYSVFAFAPISFYEFSKGEAQTGRYLPIILPIVEPNTFRTIFREIGNLIWWMGRGRYRSVSRIHDILRANVSNIDEISKKELQDVCSSMGSIGGVKALEQFEIIEKIDDFNSFRNFLIHLESKGEGGEIYAGSIKVAKRCWLYNNQKRNFNNVLEKSLRNSGVSKITDISYYLSVVLDGLSTSDGKIPLFTDSGDWKELLSMIEGVILDFEGEHKLPTQDLKRLQDNVSDFSYDIRRNAEDLDNLKEGYCITPQLLHTLFPFPTSSPNLIPDKKIIEQRENLGDQTYLGREERNSISVFFFLNEDKIKDFLTQESKSFLKETKTLIAINLGSGKVNNIPQLARWLQNQGRLKIITPAGIISDFLVSFFYWVRNEKEEGLPITGLLGKLEENQLIEEKDKARKIAYYNSRIKEYLNSELPKIPPPKYTLSDKTGFDDFLTGRVGFASELIGYAFVDSIQDMDALYKFREAFESSNFIKEESGKRGGTGVPTALERGRPVMVDKKTKGTIKGAVLRKISDSFSKHLPDLTEVVNETSRDEFTVIPADNEVTRIFEGIYLYLRDWKDPSKAEEKFRDIKSKWDAITRKINKLSGEIEDFKKLTYEDIFLTHCVEIDKSKIEKIQNILGDYQTKISPYTKLLLSTFIEKTIDVLEPKLNEIEKKLKEFQNTVEDQIKKYTIAFESIDSFEKDTYEWIYKNKEETQVEFQRKFKSDCQNFTKGGKIDLENVPDVYSFLESVEETMQELQMLKEIDEAIKQSKTKAQEINEKLKGWRQK